MKTRTNRGGLACLWIALPAALGCSADVPTRLSVGKEPPVAGQMSTAVAGGAAPNNLQGLDGMATTGGPSASAPPLSSAAPATPDGVAADVCAHDSYRAEQAQLTVYTLFDDSASMLLWWEPVTDAFTHFVRDPRSAGIKIGLKFFGIDCDPAVYAKPDIAIGPLPQNAEPIVSLLTNHVPLAQTPTRQALQGALMALNSYAADHPQERAVILLVTDVLGVGLFESDEADCYSTVSQAAEVAATALAGTPSIHTYVLGLGDATSLNMLSQAGGTGDAVSVDSMASDKVVEAIGQIRKLALPCDYALPMGGEQNPKLVNLEFNAAGGDAQTVPGVASERACDPTAGGWYYDDPAHPKRIVACETTCAALNSADEVNVVLGCPTIGPD